MQECNDYWRNGSSYQMRIKDILLQQCWRLYSGVLAVDNKMTSTWKINNLTQLSKFQLDI